MSLLTPKDHDRSRRAAFGVSNSASADPEPQRRRRLGVPVVALLALSAGASVFLDASPLDVPLWAHVLVDAPVDLALAALAGAVAVAAVWLAQDLHLTDGANAAAKLHRVADNLRRVFDDAEARDQEQTEPAELPATRGRSGQLTGLLRGGAWAVGVIVAAQVYLHALPDRALGDTAELVRWLPWAALAALVAAGAVLGLGMLAVSGSARQRAGDAASKLISRVDAAGSDQATAPEAEEAPVGPGLAARMASGVIGALTSVFKVAIVLMVVGPFALLGYSNYVSSQPHKWTHAELIGKVARGQEVYYRSHERYADSFTALSSINPRQYRRLPFGELGDRTTPQLRATSNGQGWVLASDELVVTHSHGAPIPTGPDVKLDIDNDSAPAPVFNGGGGGARR